MQLRPLHRVTARFTLITLLMAASPVVAQPAPAAGWDSAARASCEAALAAGRYGEALPACQAGLHAAEKRLGLDPSVAAGPSRGATCKSPPIRVPSTVQLGLGPGRGQPCTPNRRGSPHAQSIRHPARGSKRLRHRTRQSRSGSRRLWTPPLVPSRRSRSGRDEPVAGFRQRHPGSHAAVLPAPAEPPRPSPPHHRNARSHAGDQEGPPAPLLLGSVHRHWSR